MKNPSELLTQRLQDGALVWSGQRHRCELFYWTLQDANYNVLGVVDEVGTLVERYEYTPYGERQVYRSAGSNDPRCHARTIESRRCQDEFGTAPYSLCDFGMQGKPFEKECGLYGWNARMYHPRLARAMQPDPLGYPDGMNGFEWLRSNPLGGLDPYGTTTLATKIMGILAYRIPRGPVWNYVQSIFGWDTYHLQDEEDELRSDTFVRGKMNDFYEKYLNALNLPEGQWRLLAVPLQSADKMVGQFAMKQGTTALRTWWWLNGSHAVKVQGSLMACKTGPTYKVTNLHMSWVWVDEIDGKSFMEFLNEKPREHFATIISEGLYDVICDKLLDVEFYVHIHFTDSVLQTEIPPGPQL